jgi:Bacteriophage baseplate protein W
MKEDIHSIKYPFAIDGKRGMLQEERDYEQHVRQLMLQVLFTNPGERVNRPDFGCGVRRMVFAPNSDTSASLLQVLITQALDEWLGTVIITNKVDVTAINETLEVSIGFTIKATQQQRFLNVKI